MDIVERHEQGAAVEDVQRRLAQMGYLTEDAIDGIYEERTAAAVSAFCRDHNLPTDGNVDPKIWAKIVDESYELGDRVLYLRVPFFHGKDVRVLQNALSALGFATGGERWYLRSSYRRGAQEVPDESWPSYRWYCRGVHVQSAFEPASLLGRQ